MNIYRISIILAILLAFLLFRISSLGSSVTYYIYEPESKGVFLQQATPSYGVKWTDIINPFAKLDFMPDGYVEYRGSLPEIQSSIDHYNTLNSKNRDEAFKYYMGHFHIDIERHITSSTFNYKGVRNPLGILPKEWEWLTKHKIEENDVSLIDFIFLKNKEKSDSDVFFFPNCLLIRGEMAQLLDSKLYGHFQEFSSLNDY